ncbi:MAG: alpha-mannosidase, partial [Anaerolineales bacterium]|nr:alpha-mannosidase [Anaerolineales bacterium]
AWELVCLNQFHDIIPGSSIAEVYLESLEQYAEVRRLAQAASQQALANLARQLDGTTILTNPTSFPRHEPVQVNGQWQDPGELPPFALQAIHSEPANLDAATGLRCEPGLLENAYLRVEFDAAGDITGIYDKRARREVLAPGAKGNQFVAFEDRPLSWDAWDIDIFYEDKSWLAEPARALRVIENGPYRATLEIERQILNSTYTQRVSLSHNSARLDFETDIDWQERRVLLKVAFPVQVFSPKATFEIQWGNVERPTHRNTSWDWARFETAAQKWVDLSEGDYGVSLLNDCKYGHDIHENVLRLTLLRGTTAPDPMADAGRHTFRYSLLPHAGSWDEHTVAQAYALNDPLIIYQAERQPQLKDQSGQAPAQLPPLVQVDRPNLAIETIKQAEDGQGLVVRLYEFQRQRGPFKLQAAFEIERAWLCNLLEENQAELVVAGHQLQAEVRPYQILTLRLVPKQNG